MADVTGIHNGTAYSKSQKQFWESSTNASDPAMMRYASQQDTSVAFNSEDMANQAVFQRNFQNLEKSVDTNNLYMKAFDFHKVRPQLEYGVDHYEPLDPRVLQYFGLSTGGGVDPLPPIAYPKRYSAYGA